MHAFVVRSLAALGISLIASCGSRAPRTDPTPTAQTRTQPRPAGAAVVPATDIAPRPFTPEQIAAAMPVGTAVTYRFEPVDKPAYIETWTVTAADAETATMVTRRENADGTVETKAPNTSKWRDLAAHATFPASTTTIEDGKLVTPAGTFATRVYTVKKDGGLVQRYHFAPALPGPPIKLEIEKDGAPQLTMMLISRKPPPRNDTPRAHDGR